MGYDKSGEYKKTFIGYGVRTGSMQVLHGFKFEVEPLGDNTFEVEPHENIDQGAGLQKTVMRLLFAVAVAEKIYAHESLTFNNTVACEVIFKWKARLKDDMDSRSDVYVLSNSCRKCSDDSDGYYWEYTPDDTTMSTHLVNRSPSSAIGFKKPIDMLGFFGWLASIK
nr:zinc finger, CCHC-type [Tanacetum cinerariifolium]